MGIFVAHSIRLQSPKSTTTQPVTLVFPRPDRVAEFIKAGCTLKYIGQGNETASKISTGFLCEVLPPPTNLQIGVINPNRGFIKHMIVLPNKNDSTPEALGRIKERFNSQSSILFLQDPNIFKTMEEVSARVFPDPANRPAYWAGFSEHDLGLHPASPWSVSHYASKSIRIGPMSQDQQTHQVAPISKLRDAAESLSTEAKPPTVPENSMVKRLKETHVLQTRVLSHDEITLLMLRKLAVEAVIQPLAAIFRCNFWDLLTHPMRRRILRDMMMQEVGPIVRHLHKPNLSPDQQHPQQVVRPADAPRAPLSDRETRLLQNDYPLSSKNLIKLAVDTCKLNTKFETTGMRLKVEANMNLDDIEDITGWFAERAEELKLETSYSSTLARLVKQRHAVTGDMVSALFRRVYASAPGRRKEMGGHRMVTRVYFPGSEDDGDGDEITRDTI